MIRRAPKKYCPLCKNAPVEEQGDKIYRCIRCGFIVNEQKAQSAYHKQVLVAKPSIIGNRFQRRHFIKDPDIPSRSEHFRRINKDLQSGGIRYDRDSMYNPSNRLQPGKISNTDLWMSASYANLETDAVTKEKEDQLNKRLQHRRYQY